MADQVTWILLYNQEITWLYRAWTKRALVRCARLRTDPASAVRRLGSRGQLESRKASMAAPRVGEFVDQFEAALLGCRTFSDLKLLLAETTRELGFSAFALLHHDALGAAEGSRLRMDNYPPAWVAELISAHLPRTQDPVHQACARTAVPFAWSDLPRLVRLNDSQHALLARARSHGLQRGLTVPVHMPGEPAGSFSFAGGTGCMRPSTRFAAELVGIRAFAAAQRLRPRRALQPSFSRRELQCIDLVAIGKTDWEIGHILGISPETARQYVRKARARCGVATRTQLAVFAVRTGLVD